MQTIEIDKKLLEDMLDTMGYLHKMVSRLWHSLYPIAGKGKWLTLMRRQTPCAYP